MCVWREANFDYLEGKVAPLQYFFSDLESKHGGMIAVLNLRLGKSGEILQFCSEQFCQTAAGTMAP